MLNRKGKAKYIHRRIQQFSCDYNYKNFLLTWQTDVTIRLSHDAISMIKDMFDDMDLKQLKGHVVRSCHLPGIEPGSSHVN